MSNRLTFAWYRYRIMRFFVTLLITAMILPSCMWGKSEETLYDEVMEVHDEAMAKMDAIYQLKRDLKSKADSISDDGKLRIENAIRQLDSADEGMRTWMHDFNPVKDGMGDEAYYNYLESELEKIKKVREDIANALERAAKEK